MKLIEEILSENNLKEAIKRVEANKGVAGVDKMTVAQIDTYFEEHKEEIINSIMNKKYKHIICYLKKVCRNFSNLNELQRRLEICLKEK